MDASNGGQASVNFITSQQDRRFATWLALNQAAREQNRRNGIPKGMRTEEGRY